MVVLKIQRSIGNSYKKSDFQCFSHLINFWFFDQRNFFRFSVNLFSFASIMQIEVLKSKIHRVSVTEADLDYIGSVTIDEDLMDAVSFIENEKVDIFNYNNGERFTTYVIKGERGSGVICLNGPASMKVKVGHQVIIVSYAMMDFELAKKHQPKVVFPDSLTNKLR